MVSARSKLFRNGYVFVTVLMFFVFILILFLRSFPATYNIYLRYNLLMQTSESFWTSFWFASELIGEVGLVFRFLGACLLLSFVWLLFRHRKVMLSYLKLAIFFEGSYYLFMIPFIASLFLRPDTNVVNLEAGLSYVLQIVFITPAFFVLFTKLRKNSADVAELCKWGAIAIVGFIFGLWIKHFMLMVYALPVGFDSFVLVVGTLNASLTLLMAGFVLFAAFLSLIRKQSFRLNTRLVGFGFLLVALHFIVYVGVALVIQRYWDFMMLTELWALGFLSLAIGYLGRR